MEKIINKLFETSIKDFDVYSYNGTLWVIFVDEKKWLFELNPNGTLWFNYFFFKELFDVLSMNVLDSEKYITKWFVDVILKRCVEDIIQNGVKRTESDKDILNLFVEDVIQNGVKHTHFYRIVLHQTVEDVIQNGVKHTYFEVQQIY